jgi:hypothetical protein
MGATAAEAIVRDVEKLEKVSRISELVEKLQ